MARIPASSATLGGWRFASRQARGAALFRAGQYALSVRRYRRIEGEPAGNGDGLPIENSHTYIAMCAG